ncbi:MAG: hypothetical protein EXS38_03110 [Opitutus sp.]|nr:hypothetical protein [Opitutus sp.]
MKSPRKLSTPFLCLLPIVALGFTRPMLPTLRAGEPAAVTAAPEFTDEQKVLLKALDAELARFDAMLDQDTDVQHKATVKAFLDGFKDRRDAMKKVNFDQGKYDEIRFDINVEYQRLAMWLAPSLTPPPAPKKMAAAAGENAVYKLSPSPANKADVAAALGALDGEIKRLEAAAATPAEKAKVKAIKDGRADLSKEFTKAKWDAIIGQMRPATR